jgi:hypothetical protein
MFMPSVRSLCLVLISSARLFGAEVWTLLYDPAIPQVAFSATEIRRARPGGMAEGSLERVGAREGVAIVLASGPAALRVAREIGAKPPVHEGPQSYSIRRSGATVAVLASDATGAMYGGLDVAEAIRTGTFAGLRDSDHKPHIEQRGIKFNIPLDVRTPSYSDNSDAAQINIPEMWSFDFWREFLDDMARHRFNVLSLWNLHPFPSLVKVPEFPDVALDDVLRTTVPMDDTYSHTGDDMVRPELLARTETLKRIGIDGKIRFWRDVMQYAADRGIDVYWFTWNIFTFGAEGKYGITPDQTNRKTIDYFRASVREMVLTYPLLAGFGITAGEHMQERKDEFSKEKWLWNTYGQGVADAAKLQPGRKVRMIHRYHQTGHEEIVREWRDYPGTLDLSFKYAIAHMYSIPNPPFLTPALPHLSPKLRTWLTVRDDDYYSFRWADPEYARAFIRNIPGADKVAGFYMGPDGTVWGREVLSRETPRDLVISKRWLTFQLWGRLSYDPDLPDAVFERAIATRFPQTDARKMLAAWSEASRIFPQITRFFWGDIDLRWFPEACMSHPRHRGFYTVKDFVEGRTMPGSNVLDIVEWQRRKTAGEPMNGVTPLEVADALAGHARQVFAALPELRPAARDNRELQSTLGDMAAMAHLGNYYAAKIRAAAELAIFDQSREAASRDGAVQHLRNALDHWKRYATAYTMQYRQPILYNRVGWIDIPALTSKAEHDIEIARLWIPGTLRANRPGRQADQPFRR